MDSEGFQREVVFFPPDNLLESLTEVLMNGYTDLRSECFSVTSHCMLILDGFLVFRGISADETRLFQTRGSPVCWKNLHQISLSSTLKKRQNNYKLKNLYARGD